MSFDRLILVLIPLYFFLLFFLLGEMMQQKEGSRDHTPRWNYGFYFWLDRSGESSQIESFGPYFVFSHWELMTVTHQVLMRVMLCNFHQFCFHDVRCEPCFAFVFGIGSFQLEFFVSMCG